MAEQDRRFGVDHGSGWLHLVVPCGLLLAGLVAFSFVGPGWGAALILVALILCPLALIAMSRRGESDR